jgi:hypothetical protein
MRVPPGRGAPRGARDGAMPKKLIAILLACAGAAAAAPVAQADIYCVKKPSCSGPGRIDVATVGTALDLAAASVDEGDTIYIGEGVFADDERRSYEAGPNAPTHCASSAWARRPCSRPTRRARPAPSTC